jgi:hypothetical protein
MVASATLVGGKREREGKEKNSFTPSPLQESS